jgi:hypothetical protein
MPQHTVDYNSWHARLYYWWYRRKHKYPKENNVSNLCPYMRAVLIWAPLRILFDDWVVVSESPKITLNAITIPLMLIIFAVIEQFRRPKFAHVIWVVYGIITTLLIFFFILNAVIEAIKEWRAMNKWNKPPKPPKAKKVKKPSEFGKLVTAYFQSGHDRICPELTFAGAPDLKPRPRTFERCDCPACNMGGTD